VGDSVHLYLYVNTLTFACIIIIGFFFSFQIAPTLSTRAKYKTCSYFLYYSTLLVKKKKQNKNKKKKRGFIALVHSLFKKNNKAKKNDFF